MTEIDTSTEAVGRNDGWLIHKQGRGWYRPEAKGYTAHAFEAGRFSYHDAVSYSHPNGLDGPRDGITIKHESDLPPEPPSYAALAAERDALKAREQALVAAAYEAAAQYIYQEWDDDDAQEHRAAIRALTPDDARAALDRMLAEAEARGAAKERARCAGIADKQAWAHGGRYFDGPERNSAAIAAAIREGETP